MDSLFERSVFNAKANFGLLRKADIEYADLAHFIFFHGAEDYDELKVQVKDFDASRKAMELSCFIHVPT